MTVPQSGDAGNWWPERGGVPVTVATAGIGSQQLVTGIGLIIAVTFVNANVSTPARSTLHDGADATGTILAILGAPASGGGSPGIAPPGIYFGTGLYYAVNTGNALMTVTYIPLALPLK